MRLLMEFDFEGELNLPIQYNNIVQGFIYDNLGDEVFRQFLHEIGFEYEKRTFKLFTYSKIMGSFKLDKQNGRISFTAPIKIVISSPVDQFINEFGKAMIENENLRLGRTSVTTKKIEVSEGSNFGNKVKIRTLSPMVAYSTVMVYDKKKTIYHKPGHDTFDMLMKHNLEKKYYTIFNAAAPIHEFSIVPVNPDKMRKAIITYKGTVIKGYTGDFYLTGAPELIRLAYDTGLGSKNSQGFGLFEVIG